MQIVTYYFTFGAATAHRLHTGTATGTHARGTVAESGKRVMSVKDPKTQKTKDVSAI